tara:strand:- start:4000 stop:5757 length:1758 start_codon:yes stop_codon:yes gene_type:complete
MKLLEHFKELTVHPKNAEELKGLILQLAVQGKLTKTWREENPDVEPASELLKRIQFEKELLIKEKKIKKEKQLPKITDDEIPYKLPESWEWCRMGNITEKLGAGSTPLGGKTAYVDEGIMFFRSQNIHNNQLKLEHVVYIPDSTHEKMSGTKVKPKDLLLNITGGSIGRCALVPDDFGTANVSQHVAIVRLVYLELREFMHSLIISEQFQSTIMDVQVGVSREGLSMTKLKLFLVPLPPLEEQKAIVRIVNQLFKEVEELEQQTKARIQLKEDFVTSALQQLANGDTATEWAYLQKHFKTFFTEKSSIKKLRESILQLAVQGKLTKQWRALRQAQGPPLEPATTLLERIKAEKEQLIKEKKIKKEKPLPEISDAEIPYDLPEGWVWCRLGDLVAFMAYGTSQKTNDNHYDVPVLRMGNITSDGNLHFNNLKFIPATHKDLPKLYLKNGDLVFNRTNSYELVGKTGVFKGDDFSYTLASYLIKVSLYNKYVDSDYINNYIISPISRKTQIEPQITAQTNQANFSGSKLKVILIPFPPIEEQNAIVEKINDLVYMCDNLGKEKKQNTQQLEDLMQSCLKEVIEGEKI